MSRLAATFERCRAEGRAAFVPFLVAGDPDLAATERLLVALARAGADVLEVGVPFSDPIADGPVIQAASARSLAASATLSRILELVARCRERVGVPIVLFTSPVNPILAHGLARFAEQAAASGVDGVLIVDLPPEEAEEEALPALRGEGPRPHLPAGADQHARPGGPRRAPGQRFRLLRLAHRDHRRARGAAAALAREVAALRKRMKLPIVVGFGVSTPEQAAEVARSADGVVVGSALVRLAAECADEPDFVALVGERARQFAAATVRPEPPRRRFGLGRRRG